MNGLIARTLAAACVAGAAVGGCVPYRNLVDPCYPQRYNTTARREVMDAFAPQVQNGHVLDQTVFNYHFDKGTDKLNPMGLKKLHELTQRRPQPDANVFLATATDFDYNPENPEAMVDGRRDMDQKRVAAIQRYLTAQLAGRPMQFEILVHDPYEPGANGAYAAGVMRTLNTPTSGSLGGAGTGGGSGGGNQTGQFSGQGNQGNQGNQGGQGSSGSGTTTGR